MGKQYYGIDYYLTKSPSSIRSDDIFEQLCDALGDEQATLLADYAFSMLFFKTFFEFDGVLQIPTSEAEWNQLSDKVSKNLEQLTYGLFNGIEKY